MCEYCDLLESDLLELEIRDKKPNYDYIFSVYFDYVFEYCCH